MSMLGNIMALTASFMVERKMIQAENERRADEAAAKYFDAAKYPRKKKKQVKKEAFKEYQFWKGLAKWEEEMNGK